MKNQTAVALSTFAAVLLAGCASVPNSAELDKMTADIVKASFTDKGIVKVAVLNPEDINVACSAADVAGKPLEAGVVAALQAAQLKTIKWRADGDYMGDWKAGEKLAQSGRGMTWTDKPDAANGGNCYNCHRLDPKEISYGTIGPSLYNYGKIRGVTTDPTSPSSKAMIEYTWGKIWNAKAYNACSVMPRAIHKGIITETQARDLMALLLDPKSPVNQ